MEKTFRDYEDWPDMELTVVADDGLVTLDMHGCNYLEFEPTQAVRIAEFILRAARKAFK